MYRDVTGAKSFAGKITEWATFVPGVYNADTLGVRPDLVGRPITSWADLISPDFKGKTAIQNIPTNGSMDAMMAMQSAGIMKFRDMGNPRSRKSPRWSISPDQAEEGWSFPRAVEHLRRVGEPDGRPARW